MPTDILIDPSAYRPRAVTVNGTSYELVKGKRYTAPDAVIGALNSAAVPYQLFTSSIIPVGQVRIPTSYKGPTRVMVNGKRVDLPKGVAFTPSALQISALAASSIPYERGETFRQTALPIPMLKPTSTTGAASNSGAVISYKAAPVPHPDGRTSFVAIKTLAADTFSGARWTALAASIKLQDVALVGMWVYWSGQQGSVALRFTSDAFGGKSKTFSWAWSGQLHQGWNLLTVAPGASQAMTPGNVGWTVGGGFLDSETVNGIEVQVNTNGGADTEIFLGDVFYHTRTPTRGAVCFGFDAFGEASIPNLALPILAKYGVKAYWAGDANLIDTPTNARAMAEQWYAAGHDLITQGYNHVDYTSGGNAALIGADYRKAQAVHRALGFKRGLGLFSYPLSANNDATDAALAAEGVVMARSGWAWGIHPNEFNNGPKLIGHGAVNLGGRNIATARGIIDHAKLYGITMFPFCHGLTAGTGGGPAPADTLKWYADDWDGLIAYAIAQDVDVVGPTQWLAQRGVNPSS